MSDEKLIAVVAAVSADGAGGTVGSATAKRIVEAVKAHEEETKPKVDPRAVFKPEYPEFKPSEYHEFKATNVKPNVVKTRK